MLYSKSRLFITSDMYKDDVWFARTKEIIFARLQYKFGEYYVWFYTQKYRVVCRTLTEALKHIEKVFALWYFEKYLKDN